MDGCITIDGCTPNGKKQKARPRGVNLNARERNSQCDIGVTTAPSALYIAWPSIKNDDVYDLRTSCTVLFFRG